VTWYDVKLAALQKMFASDGTDISNPDEATKEYLNAMPHAANEAIEMLCTAGRYLRKSYMTSKDKGEALTVNLEYEVPDYWRMGNMEVYKLVDDTPEPVDGVALYGGKYLVFPAEFEGDFEFFYDAKPTTITLSTPDSKKIDLPDDAVVLLPLYIASQLYKDDDNAIATMYRNEFETAFERLTNPRTVTREKFSSNTGWW
jgi:hypothetical protein